MNTHSGFWIEQKYKYVAVVTVTQTKSDIVMAAATGMPQVHLAVNIGHWASAPPPRRAGSSLNPLRLLQAVWQALLFRSDMLILHGTVRDDNEPGARWRRSQFFLPLQDMPISFCPSINPSNYK